MTSDRPTNLADLVRRTATATPDKIALLYREQRLAWGALDTAVDRAAGGLLALGLDRGDRVAMLMGNIPELVVAYFGALRAGLVAVPINTGYTVEELRHLLADSGARAIVCGRGLAETAAAAAAAVPGVERVVVADVAEAQAGASTFDELLAAGADQPVAATGGGEDLAVLMYTSGTSGRPRGAMLSHRALLANLEQCARIEPPIAGPDDIVLIVLPLFHIYGLNTALGTIAWHGATGVLVERFDPADALADVRRHHVTNIIGAPPMFIAWSLLPDLAESFDSVRLAVSGAAPLPTDVFARILDVTGRPVFEGYGLTETAPVLTTALMSEIAKPGSVGRAVPGVELRLVDEDGGPTVEGDPGEIAVRGANLFSGYWPDGSGGADADGWFATGDVAYADPDGDLFLVDRRKELILVSGFNVYPREVEDALTAHPDIREAAVLAIPHPYTGESVKAMIVLRSGARLSAEDVIGHAATRLARFKCPTAVQFVDALPHSVTGKVAKGRLREAARGAR
ncbi:MAG: AMP-binding protein [Frankiaceae bacterium]